MGSGGKPCWQPRLRGRRSPRSSNGGGSRKAQALPLPLPRSALVPALQRPPAAGPGPSPAVCPPPPPEAFRNRGLAAPPPAGRQRGRPLVVQLARNGGRAGKPWLPKASSPSPSPSSPHLRRAPAHPPGSVQRCHFLSAAPLAPFTPPHTQSCRPCPCPPSRLGFPQHPHLEPLRCHYWGLWILPQPSCVVIHSDNALSHRWNTLSSSNPNHVINLLTSSFRAPTLTFSFSLRVWLCHPLETYLNSNAFNTLPDSKCPPCDFCVNAHINDIIRIVNNSLCDSTYKRVHI